MHASRGHVSGTCRSRRIRRCRLIACHGFELATLSCTPAHVHTSQGEAPPEPEMSQLEAPNEEAALKDLQALNLMRSVGGFRLG